MENEKQTININTGEGGVSSVEFQRYKDGSYAYKTKIYGNETTESLTKIEFIDVYMRKHYGIPKINKKEGE